MINWKRPLGLEPLLMTLLTLTLLTGFLVSMVWSRVSLLQNGTEVALKTAPVDPRDLLRGYYVQLGYEIGTLKLATLERFDPAVVGDGFRHNDQVYVRLRPQSDGFAAPVSIHREMPALEAGFAVIRGRVNYDSCSARYHIPAANCTVSLSYGIEKFFAPKDRAISLENARTEPSPELDVVTEELNRLQVQIAGKVPEAGKPQDDEWKRLREEIDRLAKRRQKLIEENRQDAAKHFAVLVRVSPSNGDAAIAGLMLDGKRIYDERLF